MIGYAIEADSAQLKDVVDLFQFIGGNTDDALRIAINRTGPKVKTASSKAIRSQVRLSASYVGERLQFTKASRAHLSGKITTPSRGLLLSRFSTDPLISGDKVSWVKAPLTPAAGIFVKVKPTGARRLVGGDSETTGKPFYMLLPKSRTVGIAARRKNGGIKVFHGPSLSQVFNTVRDDVMPDAGEELTVQMADAIRYLLTKRMPVE